MKTIDTETGTRRAIEVSDNVTLAYEEADSLEPAAGHRRWEFETDPDIERPPDAEPPSLEQRVWKLLIY